MASNIATASITNTLSFTLLLATMLWLPIPKAGMMPGAFTALMLFAWGIAVFATLSYWTRGADADKLSFSASACFSSPWLIAWGIFSTCIILQLTAIPTLTGWERFFGSAVPLELNEVAPSSINTLSTLLVWAFFSVMWLIACQVANLSVKQVSWLLFIVFIASLFQAVFGLWHFLSENTSVLGLWDKQHYIGHATGTFVNRNHFSGFLAISWPLVLSALISPKPLLFSRLPTAAKVAAAIFYSLIIVVALVSSHSRMGTAAAFFGLIIWTVHFLRTERRNTNISFSWLPWALIVSALLFSVWFGVDDIVARYIQLENGNSRFEVWAATLNLPFASWLFGIGAGAFEDVFHLVQPSHYNVRFIYAHNDYLEFLLEFGLIGSLFIFGSFLFWAKRCIRSPFMGVRAGAFASICAIALHSLVDFNLQVPASALYFWVAVGLLSNKALMKAAYNDTEKMERLSNKERSGKKQRRKKAFNWRNRRDWVRLLSD